MCAKMVGWHRDDKDGNVSIVKNSFLPDEQERRIQEHLDSKSSTSTVIAPLAQNPSSKNMGSPPELW